MLGLAPWYVRTMEMENETAIAPNMTNRSMVHMMCCKKDFHATSWSSANNSSSMTQGNGWIGALGSIDFETNASISCCVASKDSEVAVAIPENHSAGDNGVVVPATCGKGHSLGYT